MAIGLLGIVPDNPPADWTSDTVEAGLLGTVLADPTEAEATVRRLRQQIPAAGQWAAREALIQAECGEWLGLVG